MNPKLCSAIELAKEAHKGQLRQNGDDYVEHPIAVLRILMEAGLDLPLEAYLAAVLHDVLEETEISEEELRVFAGEEVVEVVKALTKGEEYYRLPRSVRDHRYCERIAALEKKYPYILLIKMADKIHNLETIDGLLKARRDKILRETQTTCLPFFRAHLHTSDSVGGGTYETLLHRMEKVLEKHMVNSNGYITA